MLNRVILIGRLTRDPTLRFTPEGVAVCQFTLAVDRPAPRDENGKRPADFIDCVAWRKAAEQVAEHLAKGRLVAVEGRLQIRPYTDRYGVRRRAAEIIVFSVRFLDSKKDAQQADADAAIQEPEPEALPEEEAAAPPAEPEPAGITAGDDVPF